MILTDEVSVLARNIHFARRWRWGKDQKENDLSVGNLVRACSSDLKASGFVKGLEVFLDNKDMTGYLDGLDCSG
jgi:hypothetical protein